ncbi:hypothetical protein [Natronococcus occultus]|uniref:Uncharacterized protein n=1 Tax=Natronococcus occultus SP4 TaxID=694430 RepID=L0JYD3_9EURY|nr:hypothetical protein [Natronococcus occultus]AGB38067.1 hypothetical protein Natoc_2289 [Natronococcus occultus SP4]
MDQDEFEEQYPEIASLLGDDWWSKADTHHQVYFSVVMDNWRGLDYYSRLIGRTPAEEIATEYENDLYSMRGFDSFFSELIGYVATERWLCDDPGVLDVKGTTGLPEYGCEDLDVEVACIRESQETKRIRVHLAEELNCEYKPVIRKKHAYNNYASNGESWAENERQVDEVIDEIGSLSVNDLPVTVETDAFEVEVLEPDSGELGGIIQSGLVGITPDENEKIPGNVRQKAAKQRGERPLIVFIDMKIETVHSVEEVVEKVIGEPYGYASEDDVEVSSAVQDATSVWENYLTEVGAIPGGFDRTYPAIRPGDEGVFASDDVSGVAGVMVRFSHNEVAYVPNVYTDDVDAKGVFNQLGWGLDTRSLKPSDI